MTEIAQRENTTHKNRQFTTDGKDLQTDISRVLNRTTSNSLVVEQLTLGGDPFSSTGGGGELALVLVAGESTL